MNGWEYLSYQKYSELYEKNNIKSEEKRYTVNIIQSSHGTYVFLGIYNQYGKNINISNTLLILDDENDENHTIEEIKQVWYLNTTWFKFNLQKECSKYRFRFKISFPNDDFIFLKPPMNEIMKVKLAVTNTFQNKNICIYEMALDLLYLHAIVFIYLINKLEGKNSRIMKILKEINTTFNNLNKELKRKTIFITDEERIDFIKQMYIRFNNESQDEYIKKISKEFSKFEVKKSKLRSVVSFDNIYKYLFKHLPRVFYLIKAQVNLVKNPKLLWTCLRDIDDIENDEIEIFELFRRAISHSHYKINQETDLKYIYGAKEIVKQFHDYAGIIPYLGSYEQSIMDKQNNEINNRENIQIEKGVFFNSIVSNSKIRKALDDTILIGVIGHNNAGVSTFVDFLLENKKGIGSAINETKEMSAYVISEKLDILIVDYPRQDGNNEFYKIQFELSKFTLDYVFVVFDATQINGSGTIDIEQVIKVLKDLGVKRYCVIINKMDLVIDELEEKSKGLVASEINTFLKENQKFIIDNLEKLNKERNFQTNRNELETHLLLVPTILNISSSDTPDVEDRYTRAGIYFGERLKTNLMNIITKNNQEERIENEKKCFFQFLKNNRYIGIENILSRNDPDLNDLNENIKDYFKIESFCIKSELSETIMYSIDDFFNYKGYTFIVCNH